MNIFNKKETEKEKNDPTLNSAAETIHNEQNVEEPEEDYISKDEEDYDKFTPETPEAPKNENTDKKYDKNILLYQLSELVRELADAEEQLKQKRVYWKSDKSMTGLMTINEIITIAERLKFDIKKIGDILIEECGMEDDALNNKIKDFSGDIKTYDFWLK